MARRTDPPPTDADDPTEASEATGAPAAVGPNLAAFPVVGLTRRRMAAILGVVLAAWIVIVFARQVGDAVRRVEPGRSDGGGQRRQGSRHRRPRA